MISTMTQEQAANNDDGPTVPPWMLATYEEKEIRKRTQELTNEKCQDVFSEFAKCSERHQILFSFKCKDEKKAMIDCVSYWGSDKVFEEQRNIYIQEKIAKLEGKQAPKGGK